MARRYLIVGTGGAGVAAAEAIQNHDPGGHILLIGDEPHGFYSRPGLAYLLTGEVPERQLFLSQARSFQQLNARAVKLNPQAHQLTLDNGDTHTYDRLLIATGSSAVMPAIPGIDLAGMVKLDNLDDARHILKLARRGKSAVVIGGGITALEIVEGLVTRGVKTHYLMRGNRYWRNVLDETESSIVEQRLRKKGVQLHYGAHITEIEGKKARIEAIHTNTGQRLKCNIVAIAVGVRPRLSLAQTADLRIDRGILTDEYLQTSAADVFAAGDVAQVFDPLTNAAGLDTLWGVAVTQGRTAGQNMVGGRVPYQKRIPFNVTRLADLTTTLIGMVGHGSDDDLLSIARGDSETWRYQPDGMAAQTTFEVNRLRLVIGPQTILGAVVMGDQTLSQPLHHLITHQVDISAVRDQLLAPHALLPEIVTKFWTTWRQTHATP